MLSIYASIEQHETLRRIIAQEARLDELVRLADHLAERPQASANSFIIRQGDIWPLIDWQNLLPPYLLPESVPGSAENLLGLVFARLGNYEKAQAYLRPHNPALYAELDILHRLALGLAVAADELPAGYSPFDEYRLMHNQAIVRHYAPAPGEVDVEKTQYFYLEALQSAPNDEHRAFTARHFAVLLMDLGQVADAERVLRSAIGYALSEEARMELRYALCQAWLQQLSPPYDAQRLGTLKDTLWQVLQYYEAQGRRVEQALCLCDAGTIANYAESWAESLNYFGQALAIFEAEDLPDLAAETHYRKGNLLFTWAQQGNPQFYRSAAESYQKALRRFGRAEAPEWHADIQQHLGIIYAELPDEPNKQAIWAAMSASAFQEALSIYDKARHPYDYAATCNHYANALVKYPAAKLGDNVEKALFYYQEALDIRQADAFPLEHCLTLLNYIEAQWHLGMAEDRFEAGRYADMRQKAERVLAISPDPLLHEAAKMHLARLELLREAYAGQP